MELLEIVIEQKLWEIAASMVFTIAVLFLYHYRYAKPMVDKRTAETNEKINKGVEMIEGVKDKQTDQDAEHKIMANNVATIQRDVSGIVDNVQSLRTEIRVNHETLLKEIDSRIKLYLDLGVNRNNRA
jgi:hypothetical protein